MHGHTKSSTIAGSDAYSIGPRPSGLGPPPTGAPAGTAGPGPSPAPHQAADASQDAYVTGCPS